MRPQQQHPDNFLRAIGKWLVLLAIVLTAVGIVNLFTGASSIAWDFLAAGFVSGIFGVGSFYATNYSAMRGRSFAEMIENNSGTNEEAAVSNVSRIVLRSLVRLEAVMPRAMPHEEQAMYDRIFCQRREEIDDAVNLAEVEVENNDQFAEDNIVTLSGTDTEDEMAGASSAVPSPRSRMQ